MDNFNKQRFLQVAKWDLTINRSFYRNLSIITLAGVVAISIFAFFIRWMVEDDVNPNVTNRYTVAFTLLAISYFTSFIMLVSAGCINHPLRNKQGRISALTIPATNSEKFLWHTLLMTVGCFIFCVLCIVAADAIYMTLSIMVFPTDEIHSISLQYVRSLFGYLKLNPIGSTMQGGEEVMTCGGLLDIKSVIFAGWMAHILSISVFAFGNAIKYKYNIILTILFLFILQFVFSILFFTCVILFGDKIGDFFDAYVSHAGLPTILNGIFIVGGIICLVISAVLWYYSYRLYCKAQVTSNMNKN